jgi:hypothetical protein
MPGHSRRPYRLELSPDARRNLGLQARSHIVRNFALQLAVEKYEQLYLDR